MSDVAGELVTPPRRPRRARGWVWLLLLVAAYAGGYVALRSAGQVVVAQVRIGGPSPPAVTLHWVTEIGRDGGVPPLGARSWWARAYKPCIATEHWWLNR